MSFGGPVLRQHVVEFIADATIGGVYTDGVRNSTSLTGPWTFVVPVGVTQLITTMVSGAGGGGGGYGTGASLAGGGGGDSGIALEGAIFSVLPNSSVGVTIGAGGAGGAIGVAGSSGGATVLTGLRNAQFGSANLGQVGFGYVTRGGSPGTVTGGGGSGQFGNGGSPGSGGLTQAAPTGGGSSQGNYNVKGDSSLFLNLWGGSFSGNTGGGGGGASTTVTTAGASGGGPMSGGNFENLLQPYMGAGGSGATTTTISLGGGGVGSASAYGRYGAGGSATAGGGVAGSAGTGYGAGGGGGSGNAAGGNGSAGYVSFTYWSAD